MNATGLDLTTWLRAVAEHGSSAREHLIAQGHHPNVIYAKAEKSARRMYTDYGVIADRPWLTDKGRAWLAAADVLDTTSSSVIQPDGVDWLTRSGDHHRGAASTRTSAFAVHRHSDTGGIT